MSYTQAVTATLNAADVIAATGSDNRLVVSGNSNVSLTLLDAAYDGQVLIDDHAYEQYTMGLATILIEDPIVITVL